MKHTPSSYCIRSVIAGLLLGIVSLFSAFTIDDGLDSRVKLPGMQASRYTMLEKITEETGFLFIYDSHIFNDEQILTIPAGEYTLRKAIQRITGNQKLELQIVGNHILISLPEQHIPEIKPEITWFTIEGKVTDPYTYAPIPFVAIGITGTSTGTITNMDGSFRLQIPDSLLSSSIRFSHLGYEPLEIENKTIANEIHSFTLEPKIISLQEVVVRLVNPKKLIEEMLEDRKLNNATSPAYLTTFYREGIENRKKLINLTEGVFKVYKAPYHISGGDQVKLLKMRHYKNIAEKDTVITKIKAGVQGTLQLDFVKNLPDFLMIHDPGNPYIYTHSDLTMIDGRLANVISFTQAPQYHIPLYQGEIYLDHENNALLMVRFQINPLYVDKATNLFVERKSRGLHIKTREITYTISYKHWNGTYYINHIRGDLHFNVRKRRQLFNSHIHTWFEMVTCDIHTENVQRFPRRETLPQSNIFANTKHVYDASFWENFNVIIPEEELSEALSKITSKLEEINE
ncbi:MAG: carboxypeptidase-like regulatory domain-containing protein [Tannerellaceae bacterium]|nr:carboxypeptidase-like regulatory domain-containing protein [Tannerellaceae bacterium]